MTTDVIKGPCFGQRHVQTVLLFLAVSVNFMSRFTASIAVVAMTNANTTNPDFPEYDWNEQEKSYILSSFFWGYVISQLPGGYLARRFRVKYTAFTITLGSSIFILLTPFCVPWGGWQAYCVLRTVQGLFQGPLLPCLHAHLAAWCPLNERNRLGAIATSGIECGIVLAMFLSGMIAASSMGWPGISYVSCGIGVVWCSLWLVFSANTPDESKFITEAERIYIVTSQNPTKENNTKINEPSPLIRVPWKAILISVPFWALTIARTTEIWGISTLQSQTSSYLNGVFYMNIQENATFSALPYVCSWIMSYVFMFAADLLLSRKVLSLQALRKTFNSIACWIPALILIGIGFLDEQYETLAVVLMVANVGINAGNTIGSALNTIDLSPTHAGILMTIVNAISSIVSIITPLVVGVVVLDEHDRSQWQIIFLISAVIFIVGNLLYVIFGSTERQPWDDKNFSARENDNAEIIENASSNSN